MKLGIKFSQKDFRKSQILFYMCSEKFEYF